MNYCVSYSVTTTDLINETEHTQLKRKTLNVTTKYCECVIAIAKYDIAISYINVYKANYVDVLLRDDTIYIGIYNEGKKLVKEIIYNDFKII